MTARGGLTTRMVLLGAALAVVVGLAIGAMLLTIGDMRHAARMARHSEQVIASANRAEKQLLDLETGARGYELTRDARFLAPWRTAQTTLPRQTEGLAALVADNPAQAALVQQIAAGTRAYLDEYSTPLVDAVRARRPPPPPTEGKRRIDALRAQFARFDATEQALARPPPGRLRPRRRPRDHRRRDRARRRRRAPPRLRRLPRPLRRRAGPPRRRRRRPARGGRPSARVEVRGRDELARLARLVQRDGRRPAGGPRRARQPAPRARGPDGRARGPAAAARGRQRRAARPARRARAHHGVAGRTRPSASGCSRDFADALAIDAALPDRAATTLRALAEAAGAQVGALYAADGRRRRPPRPRRDARPRPGLAARARSAATTACPAARSPSARRVAAAHDATTLRVAAFGRETAVRQELHVPLVYGDRAVGVASLGRTAPGTVDPRGRELPRPPRRDGGDLDLQRARDHARAAPGRHQPRGARQRPRRHPA